MNISPDLAAKVLDADLRNIVKKVSDGGVLSPSERAMLQNCALPDNANKACRAANLVTRYAAGGRLTAIELAEVREVHPHFAPEVQAETEPAPTSTAPTGPALHLTPAPSPANGDGEVTRLQLDAWAALYGTQHRQLRRWIQRGKEKGEPCPLDDPAAMPAWIDKHLEKVRGDMRDRVLAAAAAAVPKTPPPSENSNTPSVESCAKTEPEAEKVVQPAAAKIQSFDLAAVDGVEGELVDFFRQVIAATKIQLREAYSDGTEARIQSLLKRLESNGESLRKHEAAAEIKAKRRGDLMSKAEVYETWIELVRMYAQLREQRRKRLRSELAGNPALADLPPATIDAFLDCVDVVTVEEEKLFQNMDSIKSVEDVFLKLAA